MTELIGVDAALELVLEQATRLETEQVGLAQADGRVLAEPARAAVDLPPFRSSAMDGFAVRVADCPGSLPVAHRIPAGRPADRALEPGEAMGIATGAAVPDGADAVIPLEHVIDDGQRIDVEDAPVVGANIREIGGDVARGAEIARPGTLLGPAQIAALAACGVPSVTCGRRPTVALLATGTELRRAGEQLGPGEIYESNGVMLAAELGRAGAIARDPVVVPDDPASHRAALEDALTADVVVSSGGVSVGPHDLVRSTAAALGVREVFWGIAMRPGKPLSFAVRGRTLVFGLPGNPVSSLVGAMLFVRPALQALQGLPHPAPSYRHGVLAEPARQNPLRDDFARARVVRTEGRDRLALLSGQESHMIVRAAMADALVRIPRGDGLLAAGTDVRYLELPSPR